MRRTSTPVWALAAAAALGVGVVGVAMAAPGGGGTTVTVTEGKPSQFAIRLSRTSAPAGKVTFVVRNAGSIAHELVVVRTSRAAARLPGTTAKANETGNIGETEVGASKSGTVTVNLSPGHYALICNLTGHYHAGMYTDFTVR